MARLVFLGKLGDLAGGREREAPLPDGAATVNALIDAVAAEDEALGAALKDRSTRVAVNKTLAHGDVAIGDGDEIAFLPPVSGG